MVVFGMTILIANILLFLKQKNDWWISKITSNKLRDKKYQTSMERTMGYNYNSGM
jgi:G:T-mismatch repair DNA endonuclease (very short patch repair protein)